MSMKKFEILQTRTVNNAEFSMLFIYKMTINHGVSTNNVKLNDIVFLKNRTIPILIENKQSEIPKYANIQTRQRCGEQHHSEANENNVHFIVNLLKVNN